MPLFDFLCTDCGHVAEILIFTEKTTVYCERCGSGNIQKAHVRPFVPVRHNFRRHARPRGYGLLRIVAGPCRLCRTGQLLREGLKSDD
jgi:putative FmdB family regulatory protein